MSDEQAEYPVDVAMNLARQWEQRAKDAEVEVQDLLEENLRLQDVIVGDMADRNITLADKASALEEENVQLVQNAGVAGEVLEGLRQRAEMAEALAESAQLLGREHSKAWQTVNAQLKAEKATLQERIDETVRILQEGYKEGMGYTAIIHALALLSPTEEDALHERRS